MDSRNKSQHADITDMQTSQTRGHHRELPHTTGLLIMYLYRCTYMLAEL